MPYMGPSNPHGKKSSYGHSTAHWKAGKSYADILRKYPMGPGKNPLTNNYRKRSGSKSGEDSGAIGGGATGSVGGGT